MRYSHLVLFLRADECTCPTAESTGVAKFGLQGMLLGPFLVAIGATVWDALVAAQCKEAEECGIGSAGKHYDSEEDDAGNVQSPPRVQQQRPRMERSPGEPGAVSPLIFSDT